MGSMLVTPGAAWGAWLIWPGKGDFFLKKVGNPAGVLGSATLRH